LVAVILALMSIVVRFVRSSGDTRQQLKWFGFGAACTLTVDLLGALPGLAALRVLGPLILLAGIGLGIFRYRLYDVDRLINRTLVYGSLTVALVSMFAALDVTLALIVGHGSAALAAVSAFIGALLLRPARDHIQNFVDRTFDRRRYDSLRMLTGLGQLSDDLGPEPEAVQAALRSALRDPSAAVYYRANDGHALIDGDGVPVMPVAGDAATDAVMRGTHDIGLLLHRSPDSQLVRAVLAAAGPALEHARLQAQLRVQLAEVRASRNRVIAAGDAERRRIERDLHDGAQQRLVGLALHIQSAKRREAYDGDIEELLTFAVDQIRAGVDDIRLLVHGILPPTLSASGLGPALDELADRTGAVITCDLTRRYTDEHEATVWFVACEGVVNAMKHAAGSPVLVSVTNPPGQLVVVVTDTGPGGADVDGDGLRNLADRVEAAGGRFRVISGRDGTRLSAEIPCG
jgi:signal transduction histidine kinase